MPFLPDCLENNAETKEMKDIDVLFKRNRVHIKGQEWNETVCDTPWKFVVEENNIQEGLKMSISCCGSHNDNWKLVVSRMLMKFSYNGANIEYDVGEREFNASNDKAEVFLIREQISSLIGDAEGTDKKSLKVSMTLEWTEHVGMSHFRSIRYDFRRRSIHSSLVVAVENERFFVNLEYLAQLSHFFSDLRRDSDSLQKDETTGLWLLKLEDVVASEFEDLLKMLYPMKEHIALTSENVEAVAKLADRFKCSREQQSCAEDMLYMDMCPAKLLEICEKYNMEWNIEKVINGLSAEEVKNMVTAPEFHALSQKTLKLLVIRMTKNDFEAKSDSEVTVSMASSSVDSFGSDSDVLLSFSATE